MRVIATSSLNFTPENHHTLQALAETIGEQRPDIFVIAGDLGEPVQHFEACLAMFSRVTCPRALVTGNRDLWCRGPHDRTDILWAETLPSLITRYGYSWLERDNLIVGNLGICGTMGWYDYSARDARLGYSVEQYRDLKGLVNKDAQYIRWDWSDRDFAAQLQSAFVDRMDALIQNRAVDQIVVVTHMPVFSESVLFVPEDDQWNFATAFAYNLSLGRVIAPKMKVRYVISGHTQTAGQWDVLFGQNVIGAAIVGSHNGKPAFVTLDL